MDPSLAEKADLRYSESKGKPIFDWNAFLTRNTAQMQLYNLGYTNAELDRARMAASSWVTCACGNQCAIIPRGSDGEPIDPLLKGLGIEFFNRICDMQTILYSGKPTSNEFTLDEARLRALQVLTWIEQQSVSLIYREARRRIRSVSPG